MSYRLTEFSHGAGCGCKLSPTVLQNILGEVDDFPQFDHLLVGNETKDDAAVMALDDQTAIVSTTDFFMPIVDSAYDFGAIAATNAISDIYAMAAEPLMAIAILGWPVDKIPAEEAAKVINGARASCRAARIPLAGGHSIDAPEPIFGLAVTGKVAIKELKRNSGGQSGDLLYLTKPLGIGIVTTAQKKKLADPADLQVAKESMLELNSIGKELAPFEWVHAVTDVTGFGLGGHLVEMCEAAQLSAQIKLDRIPIFDFVDKYLDLNCMPGGTTRNWKAYGDKIKAASPDAFKIIADPQTSGGLLISVDHTMRQPFEQMLVQQHQPFTYIGRLIEPTDALVLIT